MLWNHSLPLASSNIPSFSKIFLYCSSNALVLSKTSSRTSLLPVCPQSLELTQMHMSSFFALSEAWQQSNHIKMATADAAEQPSLEEIFTRQKYQHCDRPLCSLPPSTRMWRIQVEDTRHPSRHSTVVTAASDHPTKPLARQEHLRCDANPSIWIVRHPPNLRTTWMRVEDTRRLSDTQRIGPLLLQIERLNKGPIIVPVQAQLRQPCTWSGGGRSDAWMGGGGKSSRRTQQPQTATVARGGGG